MKRVITRVSSGSETVAVRKTPRQQRSKHMVDAILQAAAELFAEHGYARTTTNKIAARAGVSVGSLYQYFPNKDSLLAGLFDQHHADVHAVVGKALESLANPATALDVALRQMMLDLVALHEANPALTKALSAANLRESPAGHKDEVHEQQAAQHLVCAVLASRDDVRDGDYAAMAAVLAQTTAQLTRWLVHDAPPELNRDTLVDETVQMLVRFLRT